MSALSNFRSPTRNILFMGVISIEMPPSFAGICPSMDEPAPNGMTGVAVAAQILITSATSCVDST